MILNTADDDDDVNNYEFYSKPFFSHWRSEWDNETDVGWIVDLYRKLTSRQECCNLCLYVILDIMYE